MQIILNVVPRNMLTNMMKTKTINVKKNVGPRKRLAFETFEKSNCPKMNLHKVKTESGNVLKANT